MLYECAGNPPEELTDAQVAAMSFEDLGYESVVVLETVGALERAWGIKLPDSVVGDAPTPLDLCQLVNRSLAGPAVGTGVDE